MLTCPFCQAELSESANNDGICLSCGGLVAWQGDPTSSADFAAELATSLAWTASNGRSFLNLPAATNARQTANTGSSEPPDQAGVGGLAVAELEPPPVSTEPSPVILSEPPLERTLGTSQEPTQRAAVATARRTPNRPDDGSEEPSSDVPSETAEPPRLKLGKRVAARDERSLVDNGEARAASPRSTLSPEQNERMRTMWGGTLFDAATPLTSLKAHTTGYNAHDSTLVVRSRSVCEAKGNIRCDGADYELLDRIGEGGMGVVYAARQASIDREVAVKMLRGEIAELKEQRDKFLAEAVVTAELDHPNIVPIHDLGTNEEGSLFYSMKRVQGDPWSQVMPQKSPLENIEILLKVCDAVAFAHEKGVIHRDIKPENVMLGGFGEVLVMDWGLALVTEDFRRAGSVLQASGMGGTPAYMAPEMALGPVSAIGAHSDIYLLGAVLYEIVTGKPPHTGNDPMDCLYAVAENRIQPTETTGELVEIALKSMATSPKDRFQSVLEFQAELRNYQAHDQSLLLSERADEHLSTARRTGDYQAFAAALHGFREAANLWSDNRRAHTGAEETELAYAQRAADNGDYDLATSLLSREKPQHHDLLDSIEAKRAERAEREMRIRRLKQVAKLLVAVFLGTVSIAFLLVLSARNKALSAKDEADRQRSQAESARADAKKNEESARANAEKAEEARRAAEKAGEQRRYEAYLANIGLAAERIKENGFREATSIIDELSGFPAAHWELWRLRYLCRDFAQVHTTSGRVNSVAVHRKTGLMAAGNRQGDVQIWNQSGELLFTLPHVDQYALAVAFSDDGAELAVGTSQHAVHFYSTQTGQLRQTLPAHDDWVLSVAYAPDGRHLLTTSYDKTARLWRLSETAQPELLQTLADHTGWVWQGAFNSGGDQLATAGHDGKVVVWQRGASGEQYQKRCEFKGHEGPVYCVAYPPTGEGIASGGIDRRILLWSPNEIQATSVQEHLSGGAPAAVDYRALDGHPGAVMSIGFSPDGRRLVTGCAKNAIKIWNAKTGELYKTLRGHEREVRAVHFTGNDQGIVSGSFDTTVRVWDVGTYEESKLLGAVGLNQRQDSVMSAAFSPDGRSIVTASRDRKGRLWDAATGNLKTELTEGHEYLASMATYLDQGRKLLSAGGDGSLRLWDLSTGTELGNIQGVGTNGVVSVSVDERYVLAANGNRATYWNLESGKAKWELAGHEHDVTAVATSANGQWLLTGDASGQLMLWNAENGQRVWQLRAHRRTITGAAFLQQDEQILTSSGDHTVVRRERATGQELPGAVWSHPAWVSSLAVAHRSNYAVTVSEDSIVRVWNLANNQLHGTIVGASTPRVFAANLRRVMTSKKLSVAQLSEAAGLKADEIEQVLAGRTEYASRVGQQLAMALRVPADVLQHPKVSAVSITADERRILTVEADERVVRSWDLEPWPAAKSGPATKDSEPQPARDPELAQPSDEASPRMWRVETGDTPLLQLPGATDALWGVAISPDQSQLATLGGSDIRLWNVANRAEEMTLAAHGTVAVASFSPDGQWVVTASWDQSAKLWDAVAGRAVRKLAQRHTGKLNSAEFSPDGQTLLTTSDDGTGQVWDVSSGDPTSVRLVGHAGPIVQGRYSPDGRWIVTASRDGVVCLWNAETGEPLRVLRDDSVTARNTTTPVTATPSSSSATPAPAVAESSSTPSEPTPKIARSHALGVLSCAIYVSPQGLRVATGGEDGLLKIWDAADGRLLHSLESHIGGVTALNASHDGRRILTGSRDATVKIWDPEAGKEILTLTGHNDEITSASFSPDDTLVLTSSRDGLTVIWPSESEQKQTSTPSPQ